MVFKRRLCHGHQVGGKVLLAGSGVAVLFWVGWVLLDAAAIDRNKVLVSGPWCIIKPAVSGRQDIKWVRVQGPPFVVWFGSGAYHRLSQECILFQLIGCVYHTDLPSRVVSSLM